MEPHEFREAIRALGYSQEGFALAVGAGARSGQRWATEAVPPVVATLVRLLEERPELVAVLGKLVIEADRKSKRGRQ